MRAGFNHFSLSFTYKNSLNVFKLSILVQYDSLLICIHLKVMCTNILHKDRATLKGHKIRKMYVISCGLFDAVIAVLSDH
mgnify:CR=1 FL=1